MSGLRLDNSLLPANFNTIPFLFACRLLTKMWTAIRLSPGAARTAPFLPAQWWFPTNSPIWDLLLRQLLIHLRCALLVLCGTTFLIRMTCKTKLTVLETLGLLHPLSHLYQVTCNPFKEWNEVCLTRLIQWFLWVLVLQFLLIFYEVNPVSALLHACMNVCGCLWQCLPNSTLQHLLWPRLITCTNHNIFFSSVFILRKLQLQISNNCIDFTGATEGISVSSTTVCHAVPNCLWKCSPSFKNAHDGANHETF